MIISILIKEYVGFGSQDVYIPYISRDHTEVREKRPILLRFSQTQLV